MARSLQDARLSWWQSEDPLTVFEPSTPCTALVRNDYYRHYIPWIATVVRETKSGRVTVRRSTTTEVRTVSKEALFAGAEATRARRERDGPNVEVWRIGPLEKVYRGTLRGFGEALGLAAAEVRLLRWELEAPYGAPDHLYNGSLYRVFRLDWGPLEPYNRLARSAPEEQLVRYSYTSQGVEVVITDVPALVAKLEGEEPEVHHKAPAARVLIPFVRQALALNLSPGTYTTSFERAKGAVENGGDTLRGVLKAVGS